MSDPPTPSVLDPTAASFKMPDGSIPVNTTDATNTSAQDPTRVNGQAKGSGKPKRPEPPKANNTEQNIAEAGAGVKLTGAALKKQKQAEKAARRADKVAEKGAQAQEEQSTALKQRRQSVNKKDGGVPQQPHHKRTGSVVVAGKPSQAKGGQSSSQQQQAASGPGSKDTGVQDKKAEKRVPMFSHLYTNASGKKIGLSAAGREIHPAVLTLGLQLRDYVICGGNARTMATLLVFKKVIQSYSTPAGVALPRHLTTHLSHQITYLSMARPLSVAQGNSIRWLKKLISALDPDLAEIDAKTFLCKAIDSFIRERVTLADEVIARDASAKIEQEGDVILTYGKSSVVEKTLLSAWKAGKKFKVVVVDSRPLEEGKNLARSLLRAGMSHVQYCLLNGLADVIDQEGITKCFLGASAMLGNGRLSSRAGTAMVAMMAKEGGSSGGSLSKGKIPVIVLCESVKFTARVALDSMVMNEMGDPDVLVEREEDDILTAQQQQASALKSDPPKKGGKGSNDKDDEETVKKGLEGWQDQPNLYLVNLMYDVTPSEYLDMVISELGSLPPSAVPVVNGVHGGDE